MTSEQVGSGSGDDIHAVASMSAHANTPNRVNGRKRVVVCVNTDWPNDTAGTWSEHNDTCVFHESNEGVSDDDVSVVDAEEAAASVENHHHYGCWNGFAWAGRLLSPRNQPIVSATGDMDNLPTIKESTSTHSLHHDAQREETAALNNMRWANKYGQALLSPLGAACNGGLDDFSRSELHLAERDDRCQSTSAAAAAFKPFQKGHAPGSLASLTVTTLEELGDDDLEEDDSSVAQLIPENPDDLLYCPRILTPAMIQQIHQQLPDALKMNRWDRCFAIGLHGDSFVSMLDAAAPYTYSLVVIRTCKGHILGGFASRAWKERDQDKHSYYGTGQSFLFATHPDTEEATDNSILKFYSWTGLNDYCQICDADRQIMCMGGQGDFGWLVKDNFEVGQTGCSMTYGNPPLVPTGFFEVADLEVYGLSPTLFCDTPASVNSTASR